MIDEAVLTAIREDVQGRLSSFSTAYTTNYKNNLVNKILEGDDEGEEGKGEEDKSEERQLIDEADEDGKKGVLHRGWATKRGAVVKNWKKRFFEIREDSLAYFEKEGGALKGEISLPGYKLVRDPNALKMTIKTEIYSELGVSDPVEAYTKYEPFTLECYHPFRRRFLLKLENEAEFKLWGDLIEKVCEKADGRKLEDEVALEAYDSAFDDVRSGLYVSVKSVYKGTEEDRLTDMLMEHVKNQHLLHVFRGLNAPNTSMKVTLRGKIIDLVRGTVSAATSAAWKSVRSATEAARPKIEESLAKVVAPVRETQATLTEKGKEKTLSTITPVREKALEPVGALLAKIVLPDTLKSFGALEAIFKERTDAYIAGCEGKAPNLDAKFGELKTTARAHDSMRSSFEFLDHLLSPLSELVAKVPGGHGEQVAGVIGKLTDILDLRTYVYGTQDALSAITKKAFFTFKEDTKAIAEKGKSLQDAAVEAQKNTIEKLRHDARLDVVGRVRGFLDVGVGSVVKDKLLEACSPLVAPLDELIPESVREFFSASKILDGILSGVSNDVVGSVIKTVAGEIKFG